MEHKGIILNCFGEGSLRVEEVFHTSKSGRLRRGWAAAQPCQWDGHLAQSAVGIAVSRNVHACRRCDLSRSDGSRGTRERFAALCCR